MTFNNNWKESLDIWDQSGQCSIDHCAVMDNMELIHECKADRDTHQSNHIKRGHTFMPRNMNEREAIPSDNFQVEDEGFISQFVQNLDDSTKNQMDHDLSNIQDIDNHARFQLFDFQNDNANITGIIKDASAMAEYEMTWKKVYETQKTE